MSCTATVTLDGIGSRLDTLNVTMSDISATLTALQELLAAALLVEGASVLVGGESGAVAGIAKLLISSLGTNGENINGSTMDVQVLSPNGEPVTVTYLYRPSS